MATIGTLTVATTVRTFLIKYAGAGFDRPPSDIAPLVAQTRHDGQVVHAAENSVMNACTSARESMRCTSARNDFIAAVD